MSLEELAALERSMRPVRVALQVARGLVAGVVAGTLLFVGVWAFLESDADPSAVARDSSNRTRVVLARATP